ncbi:Chromatin modification-related protein YNG2 [Trichinella papuae]|uniref:Chromatin modification-related protein YNG2 n=1 Tax=Trichinella papuae TaxID=268474 RepID=A0A0V1NAA8_9BILA|nr:Chromatin modification-related protein YNG2 [Trichinella papuae]
MSSASRSSKETTSSKPYQAEERELFGVNLSVVKKRRLEVFASPFEISREIHRIDILNSEESVLLEKLKESAEIYAVTDDSVTGRNRSEKARRKIFRLLLDISLILDRKLIIADGIYNSVMNIVEQGSTEVEDSDEEILTRRNDSRRKKAIELRLSKKQKNLSTNFEENNGPENPITKNVTVKVPRDKNILEDGKTVTFSPEPETDEETCCFCNVVPYGRLICCGNKDCETKWFHFDCIQRNFYFQSVWRCKACEESSFNICKD